MLTNIKGGKNLPEELLESKGVARFNFKELNKSDEQSGGFGRNMEIRGEYMWI
jgi:hypothetical protein